jgi:3-isopropylmalate/(R)-2-methylmalate dehydratase small subunit
MDTIEGKVWKFGDHIDTDAIVPGRFLSSPITDIMPHAFEGMKSEFASGVREGDIIMAGRNFGCGSSREQATAVLKALGIRCIVAKSFGRIFFRNAVAIGLPTFTDSDISENFEEGDTVAIDLPAARFINLTKGTSFQATPLSPDMFDIIQRGGILELIKSHMKECP